MSADNPYGLSLRRRNTALRAEAEGKQDMDFRTQRAWQVVNTNKTTSIGLHPAYKLVPGAALPAMFDRVRRPERNGPRPGRVDVGQPADRAHRRRALVHLRHPPHHPAGGLADHAGRHRQLLAQALRLLRPQPVAGRQATAEILFSRGPGRAGPSARPGPPPEGQLRVNRWFACPWQS
jgi:hypothetical protein